MPGREKTGEYIDCANCGRHYYRFPSEKYRLCCSTECANVFKTRNPVENRTCQWCGTSFTYSVKPHSNSAGHYCSPECRNHGYLGTYQGRPAYGVKGHRPGWRSIRDCFIHAGNDFCCMCGKRTGRLCVHHIEPYRTEQNNHSDNLVTLCCKCHSKLEPVSDHIESMPAVRRPIAVAIVQAFLHDLWHLHRGRELLA